MQSPKVFKTSKNGIGKLMRPPTHTLFASVRNHFICLLLPLTIRSTVLDPNVKDLYCRRRWEPEQYQAGMERLKEVVSLCTSHRRATQWSGYSLTITTSPRNSQQKCQLAQVTQKVTCSTSMCHFYRFLTCLFHQLRRAWQRPVCIVMGGPSSLMLYNPSSRRKGHCEALAMN